MTFEQAKHREDYKFTLNGIKDIIGDIRKSRLDGFTANTEGLIGAAFLEIGYVDIEVNIFSKAQLTTLKEKETDLAPVIDYFVCIKNIDDEWINLGYLDYTPKVDWNRRDWKEQLEKDMFLALDKYVQEKGYYYDRGNSLF